MIVGEPLFYYVNVCLFGADCARLDNAYNDQAKSDLALLAVPRAIIDSMA